MTDVDTSIYKNTAPPPNLLQQYGQVVGIQNAQQQNRLLQQQQDLRAGMGDAFRQAVDPTTGKVDTNRLQAIVSQDPRTAWNTGDVIAQGQANDTATAGAQVAKLQSAQAHVEAANGYISSVLGLPGLGKTDQYDSIVKTINDMASHNANLMTPQEQQAMIASVPKGDPIAQKQFVLNAANQNFAIQKQLQPLLAQAYGSNVTVDNGQQIVGGTQASPMQGGGLTVQPGGVQKQTGPGENAQLVPTYQKMPDGTYQAVQVPRGTLPGASGVAGGRQAVAPPQAAPAPAAAPQPLVAPANRLTAPLPAAAAPVAQPAAGPAPVLAAPPPGVNASQDADVARYKADQALLPTRATNVQSLQKAQGALEAIGTGKGTDALNRMKSYILSLTPGSDPFQASVMNYDEAHKYLTDYARQQGAAGHSDAQLQASQGANASTDISNAAALDVVKTNIGRERQAIAQVQEQQNPTGIGYGQHAANFATKTDPRAFAWDQYTPDERNKILGGLKGQALQKFKDSIVIAARQGFIRGAQ